MLETFIFQRMWEWDVEARSCVPKYKGRKRELHQQVF